MVSAGAKIIGSFKIGENSKIGAGSVVIEEVPPNCTVVGVPGRIVKRDNERVPRSDMDQVHLPDPIMEDITCLQQTNTVLCNKIIDLENEMKILKAERKNRRTYEDLQYFIKTKRRISANRGRKSPHVCLRTDGL